MYNTYLPDLSIYLNYPVYIINNWEELIAPNHFIDTFQYKIALYCIKENHTCPLIIRNYQSLRNQWQQSKKMYVVTTADQLDNFTQTIGHYYVVAKNPFNIFLITNKNK